MAPINRKQYSVAQPGFIYISHAAYNTTQTPAMLKIEMTTSFRAAVVKIIGCQNNRTFNRNGVIDRRVHFIDKLSIVTAGRHIRYKY